MSGAVLAVCTSSVKGVQKSPVEAATAVADHGLEGDAHAGDWHRQVSLLADESAARIRDAGVPIEPGDFGENLLTTGIDLANLPVGTRLAVGEVLLEVTQIGKECHTRCAIFDAAGSCVMPTDGIFCKVLRGGRLAPGDPIEEAE
jgi:MOSC domain-containing protein YiiM